MSDTMREDLALDRPLCTTTGTRLRFRLCQVKRARLEESRS